MYKSQNHTNQLNGVLLEVFQKFKIWGDTIQPVTPYSLNLLSRGERPLKRRDNEKYKRLHGL